MLLKISEKSIAIIYQSSPNLPDFLRKWLLKNEFFVQSCSSRPKIDPPCQFQQLVVLSAGLIPHNSIHLLIITTDFIVLY